MERLDDLFDALAELTESRGGTKATSIRQPAALNRAAQVATELGMDESFSAAANRALEERVRAFARQRAFAAHFDRFPEDRPRLVAVALRRVAGTGHPAEGRADVVEAVAERRMMAPGQGRLSSSNVSISCGCRLERLPSIEEHCDGSGNQVRHPGRPA